MIIGRVINGGKLQVVNRKGRKIMLDFLYEGVKNNDYRLEDYLIKDIEMYDDGYIKKIKFYDYDDYARCSSYYDREDKGIYCHVIGDLLGKVQYNYCALHYVEGDDYCLAFLDLKEGYNCIIDRHGGWCDIYLTKEYYDEKIKDFPILKSSSFDYIKCMK